MMSRFVAALAPLLLTSMRTMNKLCRRVLAAFVLCLGLAHAQTDPGPEQFATRAACEATRALPSHAQRQPLNGFGRLVPRPDAESRLETCFGLYYGRHAVLDACAKQAVDFNAPCPGPSPNTEHPLRPLDIAIFTLNAHAVRLLLESGADVKRVDRPVHHLVQTCFDAANTGVCREIAALLVRHGANLDELGPYERWRQTPLITAWQMNRPFGQALLELGASINGSDNQGCTLLDLAHDRKDAAQITLLEGRGAKRGRMCTTNRAVERAKDWSSGLGYLLCVFVRCNTH